MEAATAGEPRRFDHLREHSIGLPQVLFQSITHMAPAAAVAYSIYISVPDAQQALPLSVALALIACLCAANSIGQLAKQLPSAGGLYTYAARTLGPYGRLPRRLALPALRAARRTVPLPRVRLGDARGDFRPRSAGTTAASGGSGSSLTAVVVFLLTYRDIRLSTNAGVILGVFEIGVFAALAIWMLISNAGDLNLQPFNPHHAAGRLERRLQGDGVRDPRVHRLRGGRAARRGGEEPAPHDPACGRRLGDRHRPLLRAAARTHGSSARASTTSSSRRRSADPWRDLGKVFWGGGWVLVFVAIFNSIVANSNAGVNAATRVFYAIARNGLAPQPLARTHPQFKTPNVAIIGKTIFALVLVAVARLEVGPAERLRHARDAGGRRDHRLHARDASARSATTSGRRREPVQPAATPDLPARRDRAVLLPALLPVLQVPPTYPVKYANWVAIGWIVLGVLVTLWSCERGPRARGHGADLRRGRAGRRGAGSPEA